MPPPLEDMTAKISALKQKKEAVSIKAPKEPASGNFTKVNPTPQANKGIAPTEGAFKKINPVKPNTEQEAPKKKPAGSFGGFQAGFLNA